MPTTYFEVGDWSNDGHGQSKTILVSHNLENDKLLEDAHRRGAALVGINFEYVCDEYEKSYLTYEQFHNLQTHIEDMEYYVNIPQDWGDKYDRPYFQEGPESFVALWLAVAALGEPDLTYNVRDLSDNSIKIGGYGLFS